MNPLGILLFGILTSVSYDVHENLYSIETDNDSHWEVEYYFEPEFDWEVGDQIKIHFQSDIYQHPAENLDKHTKAYLIHI